MSIQIKLILAGVGMVVLAVAITSLLSNARVRSLERAVDAAKQQAKTSEDAAVAAEMRAGEYKQKIEYLETELRGIATIARKQDEELEKITIDVGGARRDVERARRVRAIDTTVEDLCAKLAELGHPCS